MRDRVIELYSEAYVALLQLMQELMRTVLLTHSVTCNVRDCSIKQQTGRNLKVWLMHSVLENIVQ
jgi:hypothetical protein